MERMIATLYRCYENEKDFRDLFNNQKMFCLPHYEMLINSMDKKSMRKYGDELAKSLTKITAEHIKSLSADVKNYCKMYNYQNSADNCDWQNSKDSVERSISFLSGKLFE